MFTGINSIVGLFIFGALYGVTCSQCILPVAFYGGAQGNLRRGILFAFYFNVPRFILFAGLGLMAAFSASLFLSTHEFIESIAGPGGFIVYLVTGLIMVFFSAELFGLFDFNKVITDKMMARLEPFMHRDYSSSGYGAFLRGMLFSLCCALGSSSAIVFGVFFMGFGNSMISNNPFAAFLAVFAYGLGNIFSSTLLAGVIGGSTGLIENKTKLRMKKYVSIFGSLILLFIGLQFISLAVKSLM
ncbi:MAG: hypothetical protein B6U97_02680 [Candidatus Altiarchaeales archaeon ex4484_96]|nr:MAG: hypothetical protein B6U97_02680 [Candidatus Altiarchaeales archaeon ex4484_96]